MSEDMAGRVVLITGGSRGIGRETARRFLEAGARVAITGRSAAALDKAVADLGMKNLLALQADVSLEDDCRRTIGETLYGFGGIDVLINNAGMTSRGMLAETDIEVYRKLVNINFLGAVMMTRLAIDEIRAKRGSVVFISSVAAFKGLPGVSHYCSSKQPLTAFSESIRSELRVDGVHVGLMHVGFSENDPGKTIYDSHGVQTALHSRKPGMRQHDVARSIFRMVERRRRVDVLTPLGKFASVASRMVPRVYERVAARAAMKSTYY